MDHKTTISTAITTTNVNTIKSGRCRISKMKYGTASEQENATNTKICVDFTRCGRRPNSAKNMKFYINIVVIRILVLLAGHSTPQTQSSTLGSAMNRWRPRCHTGRTDIGIHTPNQRRKKYRRNALNRDAIYTP